MSARWPGSLMPGLFHPCRTHKKKPSKCSKKPATDYPYIWYSMLETSSSSPIRTSFTHARHTPITLLQHHVAISCGSGWQLLKTRAAGSCLSGIATRRSVAVFRSMIRPLLLPWMRSSGVASALTIIARGIGENAPLFVISPISKSKRTILCKVLRKVSL